MHRHWVRMTTVALATASTVACGRGASSDLGLGVEVLATANDGGWQNVDLLVSSADPLQAAKDCVERRSGAASCYSFLTREAYRAAGPKAAGDFTLTCWSARWTRNREGTTSGGLNQFIPPTCPASGKLQTPAITDETQAVPTAMTAFELHLTVTPAVTASRQVLLEGTANLPDGTRLSTSVAGQGFMGQDEAVVNGGRWRSGPFGPSAGLRTGIYEGDVTLPYGRTQPEPIQARLGRQLEKLTGPLMETDSAMPFLGQSASVKARITVR